MSELISIDLVLPYLRCNNCGDFFKGETVYGCPVGHTMCVLCWDETPTCKVEGCDKAAEQGRDSTEKFNFNFGLVNNFSIELSPQELGRNLAAMVKDLALEVPCQNRSAGCGERAVQGGDLTALTMDKHEDECGYRKVSPL